MAALKIALVGVGKIAVDQHLPSIAGNDDFELVALVSQRGVTRPGIPTYRTQAEMLAALPAVEAVANCTPPEGRHALVAEALAAGKHVLMEKPPTASLSELHDLVERACAAGRSLFATWHSRFNAAVDEARRRLADEGIRRVGVTWKEDVRRWHPGQDWIWQPGGFGVFDPGINALSVLTAILPCPVFVEKAELIFPANRDTPIAATVDFKRSSTVAPDGFSMALDWRQLGEQTWTVRVDTRSGTAVELTRGGTCLAVDGQPVVVQGDAEYPAIYRRFAALVASGRSDVDAAPLRVVADAYLAGRRVVAEPFHW